MSKVQWIKVSTDILHNSKIMALLYEKNGNQMILLWTYLLVLAGQTNDQGNIYFTATIPYDQEKLSKELAIQKPIVASSLEYFQKNEMIQINEKGWIKIENWEEYQNHEQLDRIREGNRLRQKKHYYNAKPNGNLTPNLTCITPLANAIDKNREEEDKNREEENRLDKTLFNNKNDTKFIEELNANNDYGILYGKFTDTLLRNNLISSIDATNHSKDIEAFFIKMDEATFNKWLKSFVEKRVNGNYILKVIGVLR